MVDLTALKNTIKSVLLLLLCFISLQSKAAIVHQDNNLEFYPASHLLFELDAPALEEAESSYEWGLTSQSYAYLEARFNTINEIGLSGFNQFLFESRLFLDTSFHIQEEELFETDSFENPVLRTKNDTAPPFSLSIKASPWFDGVLFFVLALIINRHYQRVKAASELAE